jgi:hypothetical protein
MKQKMGTIKGLLMSYGKRNLTTIGKLTVVKTLAMPKLIHILSTLPLPPPKVLNELRSLFEKFIWHGKPPKVNRNLMTQDISEGGLKMTNIKAQIQSLKIAWIKRLITTDGNWQQLFYLEHGKLTWELDKKSLLVYSKAIPNLFWREVCRDWADCIDPIHFAGDMLATPLWNSFFITNYNLKMLKRPLTASGCVYIKDLVVGNKFLTLNQFNEKFDIDYRQSITNTFHSKTLETRNKTNGRLDC